MLHLIEKFGERKQITVLVELKTNFTGSYLLTQFDIYIHFVLEYSFPSSSFVFPYTNNKTLQEARLPSAFPC